MITRWEIELTNKCNGKCPFCFRQLYNQTKFYELDYNDLITFFNKDVLQMLDLFILCGTQGEPTLYSKFLDFIEYVKINSSISLEISTNGSTNDDLWWYKLSKLLTTNDMIEIGIDGFDKDTHYKYRQTDYDRVLKHFHILRSNNVNVEVRSIVFDYNYDSVLELNKYLTDIDVKHNIVKSYKTGRGFEECTNLSIDNEVGQTLACDPLTPLLSADGRVMPCGRFPSYDGTLLRGDSFTQMFRGYNKTRIRKYSYNEILTDNFITTVHNNRTKLECCKRCVAHIERREKG